MMFHSCFSCFLVTVLVLTVQERLCWSLMIRGGQGLDIFHRDLQDGNNASCSLYPACANHPGDCCPNQENVFLRCCFGPGTCETTPKCARAGLEGDCCPTSNGTTYLDCCFSESPSSMPSESSSPSAMPSESSSPSEAPSSSSAPSAVPPTALDVFPSNTRPPECSAYPVCAGRGLAGNCCPSAGGADLYCCDPNPRCDANPPCFEVQAENCCPDTNGVYRACCFL